MRFLLILITALFGSVSGAALAESNFELSFSSQHNSGIPKITHQKQFNCSDQIYSIINATKLSEQSVSATLIWRNPSGKIQEQTPINLFPVEGSALAWGWLKLHQASGAALLSFIDDSIGMEEFIGDWKIELQVDNKVVAKAGFNVLC